MTHCSSSVPISLVILAAGIGSRFGGNKQMAPVGDTGKPLMYFSVLDAYRAGVRRLALVINQEIELAVLEQFLPLLPVDLDVSLVQQRVDDLPPGCRTASREKPWGTGHALWCARGAVPAQCIVINADDYYGPAAMNLLVSHFVTRSNWAMVSYMLRDTLSGFGAVNRGLCVIDDDHLLEVRECLGIEITSDVIQGEVDGKPVILDPETPVSMNIWGFGPDIFSCLQTGLTGFFEHTGDSGQKEYYLPAQVMASVQAGEGRVRVYPGTDCWQGITYLEDLERIAAVP
jgi:NDP-sugar pyrophosphorylase family protein